MKMSKLGLVFLGAMLFMSAAPKRQIYQVISAHPHDLEAFSPYIQTIRQNGRLWLVHLNPHMPRNLTKNFRLVNGSEVKHYSANAPASKSASATIHEFASKIEISNIKSDVEALANFKNRSVGTEDNQKAVSHLKQILINLGLKVSEQCYRPGACSLIADKAGDGSTTDVIMLLGHMDSVGKSFAGADDNASGTAVLLEVARVLKDYANKKNLRFFITNGEEAGLLGANFYANSLKASGEIKKLVLAINMDMVGYNSNGIVELETDPEFEYLAKWFAELAVTYTGLKSKITIGAWGSDHVPFIKGGVPTLLTIEDWSTKTPCYHQACDTPDTINYVYAGEIAKLNLSAIMTKDAE